MTVGRTIYRQEGAPAPVYLFFSPLAWVGMLAAISLLSAFSPNHYLTFVSLALLPVFASFLWRVGEPPILFFCVVFQWIQVSTKLFDANIRGLPINDYYGSWILDDAIWLSLTGLVVLAIGMRLALFNFKRSVLLDIQRETESLSPQKIWYGYLLVFFVVFFGDGIIWFVPRLSQIFAHGVPVEMGVVFFCSRWWCSRKRERYVYLWTAVLLEVLAGFTGFFSSYKQVFFVLALVFMTFARQLNLKLLGWIFVLAIVVGYFMIIWSAVKTEYRDYLSQGTGQQVVLVSMDDRNGQTARTIFTGRPGDARVRGRGAGAKSGLRGLLCQSTGDGPVEHAPQRR